jgi:hypothetical protein
MQMYLSIIVTAFLFSYWLFKKKFKAKPLSIPINVETGDIIHGAFGSLLANLSLHQMYIDVMAGILLYLAYQFAGFLRKGDAVDKDIATFTAGYFGTLIMGGIKL